jgi:hypothetical protein
MSDDALDFDDDNDTNGVKQLRAHAKQTADALKEANARLAAFEARDRESTVKSVLKAKGLNEKVASFYSGDASEDAVTKWVEEHADVFGVAASTTSGGAAPDANALAAARAAAASGGNATSDPAVGDGKRIFGDPAEVQRLIQTLPYPELVRLGYMPDPKRDPFRRPVTD